MSVRPVSARIETHTLASGLRLGAARLAGTSFVELVIAVRAGSRHEPAARSGYSHFVEHMLFRGSSKYPSSHVLNHALETLGDGLQGGTTREYSLYSVQVPPENVDEALEILGDLFANPLLSDVETEKGIVFEEMLEELDEKGAESDLDNISRSILFAGHGLSRPVLGRKATLASLTRDDIERHYRQFYRAERMVLVATGAIDGESFFAKAEKAFGAIEGRPAEDVAGEPIPAFRGPVVHFREEQGSQVEVLASFLAEGERSPGYFVQMALERVLDDGLSSRLQRGLCEKKGLLYDISASVDAYTDVGVMDLSFRINPRKAGFALGELFGELKMLKEVPVEPQELARVKARMLREVTLMFETPRYLATRVAETLLLEPGGVVRLEDWKARIEAVTADAVRDAAGRIFVPEALAAVVEGELSEKERRQIERILREV